MSESDAAIQPTQLQCEYQSNPLGIETSSPRLGWKLVASGRGQNQTAYQIQVADSHEALASGKADCWDTGKVTSDQSIQIPYTGRALRSEKACWWRVRVWDAKDRPSGYSEPASWRMGLLHESDWKAQWIADVDYGETQPGSAAHSSPIMRKEIVLANKPVKSAYAYVSGLGYYELSINGKKSGDNVLDPLFTRYDQRTLYVAHDVTHLLDPGANAIGVTLGTGWYNSLTVGAWSFEHAPWRDQPKLILQLRVEYADGASDLMVTDPSWKTSSGPIVFDTVYNGETYDARLEKPGWDLPGYDDGAWKNAKVIPGPGGPLNSQQAPIKVVQTITPTSVKEVKPGVFVCDMGQGFAGWVQLRVNGPAGAEVALRFAEILATDGDIDMSNIDIFIKSGEFQTDRYLKGIGEEVWEPRFTYHGFRYVQITGFPGTPGVDNFRGRVAHTAFAKTGEFACSNDMLNAVESCTRWSYVSNFVGIPTDCPHREKNGWTGDALIATETGLFMYDGALAYTKWLDDISDAMRPNGQLPVIVPTGGWGYNWGSGPAWDSAFVQIPWYLYLYDADTRLIERHYPKIKRYVDYMSGMATDDIVSFGLGDWCPPTGGDSGHSAPTALTSTGYYYANCNLLSQFAVLLGKPEDAAHYAQLAAKIKHAFNTNFYDASTGIYRGDCQTSQACALFWGLADKEEEEKIQTHLLRVIKRHDDHLDFGILGAKYVLNSLVDAGYAEAAYAIASQKTFPSWGHWTLQGATTLWESWAGDSSRMHVMFGDIGAWMYKAIAGINPDSQAPGFKNVIIRPNPVADLTWASAIHDCRYGRISSSWRKANGEFLLKVSLPPNTTGTIHLPALPGQSITEGGRALSDLGEIQRLREEKGRVVLGVGSGDYNFLVN